MVRNTTPYMTLHPYMTHAEEKLFGRVFGKGIVDITGNNPDRKCQTEEGLSTVVVAFKHTQW